MVIHFTRVAFAKLAEEWGADSTTHYAIAVPDTTWYREAVDKIVPAAAALGMRIIVVDQHGAHDYR